VIFPQKWLQGSAQGFNPGNPQINEFTLKGREADLIKLAPIAAILVAIAVNLRWRRDGVNVA
jgi:hypothetical protein